MPLGFSTGSLERLAPGLFRIDYGQGFASSHLATGLEKLAAEFLYVLFSSENSIPGQAIGTRFLSLLGQINVGQDGAKVGIQFATEMLKAQNQVLSSQASSGLPPEERLKVVNLDTVEVDRETQSANIGIMVINQLDQTVGLIMTLPLGG
jgi:hypothetical protein